MILLGNHDLHLLIRLYQGRRGLRQCAIVADSSIFPSSYLFTFIRFNIFYSGCKIHPIMALALTESFPNHTPPVEKQVPRSVFPDGIKTSGQHPPLYHHLSPYEDFPHEITGPTVWDAGDYRNNPERWTHWFTDEEIAELSEAADKFRDAGTPLTGISKVVSKIIMTTTEPDKAPEQLPASMFLQIP